MTSYGEIPMTPREFVTLLFESSTRPNSTLVLIDGTAYSGIEINPRFFIAR